MQVQNPYHLYLDYKGYIIEPKSYRVFPAPLMGTKFATGRTSYATLDFWQIGAMTDFSHGLNQKFLVDPSSYFYSEGLDPTKPGQIQLERDTSAVTIPAGMGEVTASYRSLTTLYLGTSTGHIFLSTNGVTFTSDGSAGATKIYNFYEIDDRFFCTTGSGSIYERTGAATWSSNAIATSFEAKQGFGASDTLLIYNTNKRAQKFRVPMGGSTFRSLKLYLSAESTPINDLTVGIYASDATTGFATGSAIATFTFAKGEVTSSPAWMLEEAANDFSLVASINYWIVAETSGGEIATAWRWTYASGPQANYSSGNVANYDSSTWTADTTKCLLFQLIRTSIKNLYFVMVESEYAFGLFNDGIRRSMDGYNWIPEPPDPLWSLANAEGIGLNAIPISRGFLIGSKRGLWIFVGGTSGLNLWDIPDYTDENNFKGMSRFGSYGVFGIEKLGIFFTDGTQIYPTNLNYLSEGFKIRSCGSFTTSGWDIFALISDGTDWYLARTNLNYNAVPKYWWIVKKLSTPLLSESSGTPGTKQFTGNALLYRIPVKLASFSNEKILIFYSNGQCEVYDKTNGPFLSSGFLTSSFIDENLVRLQKLYKSISCIYDTFPTNTTVTLGYALDGDSKFTEDNFVGDNATVENAFEFTNPTLANKIQLKLSIATTDTDVSPIITDLCWTYILQQTKEDEAVKKLFAFSIMAENKLEKLTGDIQEEGLLEPRSRQDIVNDIWTSAKKKQLLNFIGADNIREIGLTIAYTGNGSSSLVTIDRTNYTVTVITTGGIAADSFTYNYKDKTLVDVNAYIDGKANFTCAIHTDQLTTRSAHDLEPVKNQEVKGGTIFYVGSDIYSVIFNSQSPSQMKMSIEGAGSDRIQISLRES